MNRSFGLLLLIGFIFRLAISTYIYSGDVNNHISWGKDILKNGPSGIYSRDFMPIYGTLTPTYPPIPLFIFTLSQLAFDKTYSQASSLNKRFSWFPSKTIWFLEDQDTLPAFFKIWAILADIGIAVLVYKLCGPWFSALGVLFNPAFWYNSAIWGQIESIPIFFVLLSLVTLKKSVIASALALTCALLTKQSSIIFLPIYLAIFFKFHSPKLLLKPIFISLLFFWLAFLPFFHSGNLLVFPFSTYLDKIRTGSGSDFISDHALNFWALLDGWAKKSDSMVFIFNLPYVFWGYALFFIWYAYVLLKVKAANMYLATGLIALGAFFWLTKMHERYLEPSLPLLLISSKTPQLKLAYLLVSLVSFVGLYQGWWAPRIDILVTLLSQPFFLTALILILTASGFIYLKSYVQDF